MISLIARLDFKDLTLPNLDTLKRIKFKTSEGELQINSFLKHHHNKLFNQIRECISDEGIIFSEIEHEKYALYNG